MTHPFRTAVESRDITAIVQLLAEDVVFHASIEGRQVEGCDLVHTGARP